MAVAVGVRRPSVNACNSSSSSSDSSALVHRVDQGGHGALDLQAPFNFDTDAQVRRAHVALERVGEVLPYVDLVAEVLLRRLDLAKPCLARRYAGGAAVALGEAAM